MMKKILFVLMLLCLTITASVSAAEQTPQTKIKLQTQTFVDEENAFSMELPTNFFPNETQAEEHEIFYKNLPFLQIFITVSPIDEKGPWMQKDVDDFYNTFLKLNKNMASDEGTKLLENEIITLNNRRAVHRKRLLTFPKRPACISDQYTFFTPNDMIMVGFNIAESVYEPYKKLALDDMLNSITIGQKWKRFSIENTPYSYELPASVSPTGISFEHAFLAGDEQLLSGVIVKKIDGNAKYAYLPASLDNLTPAQQSKLLKDVQAEIKTEVKNPRNIKSEIITVNGKHCIKSTFNDVTSFSTSYIFVQDGNYISFDYIFADKLKDTLVPVVEKSIASVKLENQA